MEKPYSFFPELDETNYPDFQFQVLDFETESQAFFPRKYPGYPTWPLLTSRSRRFPSLEKILQQRRSVWKLTPEVPSKKILSKVCQFSHKANLHTGQGPTPSAGNLQALELYVVFFENTWIPAGVYHYNREDHLLAQIVSSFDRTVWEKMVPSLHHVAGGALLWILVGDLERVAQKYSIRSLRFLLQESGHLMQNLCLLSTCYGYTTIPFGGYFEKQIAQILQLPPQDIVTYLGICGRSE